MTKQIELSNATFVNANDVRKTDFTDGLLGNVFGLNRLRGNFVQRSLRALENAFRFLKMLAMPLLLISKPIENVVRAIRSATTKEIRQPISPPFANANVLSETDRKAFAREATICISNSNETGVSKDRFNISTKDYSVVKRRSGSEEARKLFERLPANLQANVRNHVGAFIDKHTGLVFNLILDEKPNKLGTTGKPVVHIVFGGTGCGTRREGKNGSTEHVLTDFVGLSGVTTFVPPILRQAGDIVGLLKTTFNDYDLEVKGFSMGGAIATYAGIKNDCKTVVLCPAPLSPVCQDDLGDEKMLKAVTEGRITNLSVKGCRVSDQTKLKNVGTAWERLSGHRIPHMIGGGYRVETHRVKNDQHNESASIWNSLDSSVS